MTATDHASNTIDTPEQPARPEQEARGVIDDNLRAAGWQVQSADRMDISAALGCSVAQRDKLTRQERLERLTDDLTYTADQVDRDVVAMSQIRTVLRESRDALLPAAFPDREEVPKTLVFAKDDSHAEDIVRLAREKFGEGNEFCQRSPTAPASPRCRPR